MTTDRALHNLITAADAAVVFRVDRSTVSRWAAAGTLPFVIKAPGHRGAYLFDRADVEALAASRAKEATK